MEILNWLLAAFSALSGGSTVITLFMYRKQQKRFKTAEAFEREVDALKNTVEIMRKQQEFYESRLAELQKLIVNKDAYIEQLSRGSHIMEVKHAKNKSAINKAYECRFCEKTSECPVLIQRAKNEEDYLRKIEKQ
jgi:predicted patatin/cPLA2 family phospholipase